MIVIIINPQQLVQDEYCIYMVNYIVVLEDSVLGVIVGQVQVGSDICEDSVCSTSLFPSPSNHTYAIRVTASNTLGSSEPANFNSIICKYHYIVGLAIYSCYQ